MNYQILADEITNDPLSRGYSTMTTVQVANDLNNQYRSRNIERLSGDAVFQSTAAAEFVALTAHKQALWISFCSRQSIDAFASANVAFVTFVFGAQSVTANNLADLRIKAVSRADELGLGFVLEEDVAAARA